MRKLRLTGIEVSRAVIGILLLLVILATFMVSIPHNEKAPVLAMVSGGLILTGLLPARRPEREGLPGLVGTAVGTAVAIVAAFYWLSDAARVNGRDPFETLGVVLLGTTVLLVVVLFVVMLIWGANALSKPVEPTFAIERRSIVKRLKRQLRDVVDQTRSRPIVSNRSVYFSQYDNDIFMLFLENWSMIENQHLSTYAWREHENLIENYLVQRLLKTAKIAIDKHPHHCKYGEIAQSLADQAVLLLDRVNIIENFDPLPDSCPECHQPKPAHQVNCMAAICWRCKFPTPPIKAGSAKTATITPQCHIPTICFPRGEQLDPISPIVPRIRLTFTMPQDGRDPHNLGPTWPRNRSDLRRLLEALQHEEDAATH